MDIKIHRGGNQIGGNIIEIATKSTKILLDAGLELDDEKNTELPPIDGLFDRKGYDAVFISHYHSDHFGLVYKMNKDIPFYIGEASYKIIRASDKYKNIQSVIPRGYLKHAQKITVGDIAVTPFLCDHSAFDSYMLLVVSGNERLLYTGDFRANGRKSFDRLLSSLPKNIDILICEGTTLSREGYISETETELETKAVELFQNHAPVFILQSSMNIDRIVTMYRAAKRTGKLMLQDLYLSEITSSIGGNIPNPIGFADVKVFLTRGYPPEHYRYKMFGKYGKSRVGSAQITKSNFVMCVRTSMLSYMKSLSIETPFSNGILVYSFWNGYKTQPRMQEFLAECEAMGLKIVTLHTSGHADPAALNHFIDEIRPKRIIPVHTENPEWFNTYI